MAMAVATGLPISFATQLPALPFPLPLQWPPHPLPSSISLTSSPRRPAAPFSRPASIAPSRPSFQLSDLSSQPSLPDDRAQDGPVEIPAEADPLSTLENSPLRPAGGLVLTFAIAFFLFRSLRKRAQRSKEMKFRSSGVERVKVHEEKKDTLSALPVLDVKRPPPSALQTIIGAILSGGIAYLLYNFATHVEGVLARQPMPSTYTIRQLTVTIRTIINGLCYLATFVFAANSIGLTLYSIQLAFNLGQTQSSGGGEDETNSNSTLVEAVSEEITEKE